MPSKICTSISVEITCILTHNTKVYRVFLNLNFDTGWGNKPLYNILFYSCEMSTDERKYLIFISLSKLIENTIPHITIDFTCC